MGSMPVTALKTGWLGVRGLQAPSMTHQSHVPLLIQNVLVYTLYMSKLKQPPSCTLMVAGGAAPAGLGGSGLGGLLGRMPPGGRPDPQVMAQVGSRGLKVWGEVWTGAGSKCRQGFGLLGRIPPGSSA